MEQIWKELVAKVEHNLNSMEKFVKNFCDQKSIPGTFFCRLLSSCAALA